MDEKHFFMIGDTQDRLGLSEEELMSMGIKEFFRHCADLGMEPRLSMNGMAPGLTLDFSSDAGTAREALIGVRHDEVR